MEVKSQTGMIQELWNDLDRRISDELDFESVFYLHHHEQHLKKEE